MSVYHSHTGYLRSEVKHPWGVAQAAACAFSKFKLVTHVCYFKGRGRMDDHTPHDQEDFRSM